MKLVITTTIYPPDAGGPATYTYEVAKRLIERGHSVRVLTISPNAISDNNTVVVPQRFRLRFIGFLIHQLQLFYALLKLSKNADIIYTQNPTFLGLSSFLCGWILRRPVLLRFVGDKTWENAFNQGVTTDTLEGFLKNPTGGIYTRFIYLLQKFVMKKVKKIIVPSYFLKNIAVNHYHIDSQKIKVIHNSVDLREYRQSIIGGKRSLEKPNILTIGRLVKHKRIEKIIDIMPKLIEQFPTITFSIIGGGPEREELERLSVKLGTTDRVKFYGDVSHEEVFNLLTEADIFVLNSIYEGLPHVVLEAMACLTPVVVTNIKGTDEVVRNGETGLIVSPNNNEEIKDKIILLLKDKKLREKLVENAYRIVKEKFIWENNLRMLEQELTLSIKGKRR